MRVNLEKDGWGCFGTCNGFKVQWNFDPQELLEVAMSSGTSFQETVRSSDGVGITKELCLGAEKFILFTRLSQGGDQWVIG